MNRWAAAALLAGALVLGHAVPLAVLLQQTAYTARPGDSLGVVFPPSVPVGAAVGTLGTAGTVLTDAAGMPWYYTVRVVDSRAVHRLSEQAWVFWIPGPPRFAGCFAPPPRTHRELSG